ncbi:hypothetical protein Q0N30_27005 [Priestia megaterium]|uniref:hypothetical protein n=1 Tax=Priestia megaterium TaxID=1404 RepID=UPI000B149CA0
MPKKELDKANEQVHELREKNKTLKGWKEKALNWIDKHVGGIHKRNKRRDQEMER